MSRYMSREHLDYVGAQFEIRQLKGPVVFTDLAPHTHDVAQMIAAGDLNAAASMYAAYVLAEFEREDCSGCPANMLDIWMAGQLLEQVAKRCH